jgi:hypothetical protein
MFSYRRPTENDAVFQGTIQTPEFGQLTTRFAYTGPLFSKINEVFLYMEKEFNNCGNIQDASPLIDMVAAIKEAIDDVAETYALSLGICVPEAVAAGDYDDGGPVTGAKDDPITGMVVCPVKDEAEETAEIPFGGHTTAGEDGAMYDPVTGAFIAPEDLAEPPAFLKAREMDMGD